MLFQEAPADTTGFMVLGLAVILGLMLLFVVSLVVRARNLRRDLELLQDLERERSPETR